jgi:hypothetical protein
MQYRKSAWKGGTLKQQEGKQVCTFFCRPGQRNRYSDSLRAGRFGSQIPEGAKKFSSLHPGTLPTSCKIGTGAPSWL